MACSLTFRSLFQFADVFAFLILAAAGPGHHLRHDGHHQHGAWRVHHVRRLRDRHRRAAGLPLPLAQACGALVAGLVGMVLERTIIRRLYNRPLDSILATWGISLIVTQGMLIVARLELARHRHAARQLQGRRLHLLDLSPGAVRRRRRRAGRHLPPLHAHPLRHAGARDDAERRRWPGRSASHRRASMR